MFHSQAINAGPEFSERRGGYTPTSKKVTGKMDDQERFCRETHRIWEEAGFIPPVVYRKLVELLHRLYMEDEMDTILIQALVLEYFLQESGSSADAWEYTITNRENLKRIASKCCIDSLYRCDEAIAKDVTTDIINEYGIEPALITDLMQNNIANSNPGKYFGKSV
jgi:hypothetical protein